MTTRIEFGWDPAKAASNLAKHRIAFEEAMTVFLDPLAMSRLDDPQTGEERWITIGLSRATRLLVVIHTHVDVGLNRAYIRIISSRPSTKREKRHYEQAPTQD